MTNTNAAVILNIDVLVIPGKIGARYAAFLVLKIIRYHNFLRADILLFSLAAVSNRSFKVTNITRVDYEKRAIVILALICLLVGYQTHGQSFEDTGIIAYIL